MDVDGEEEDGEEAEVDDGVDEYGDAAGLEVAELDEAAPAGDLEQEARGEKDEQYHRHEHRPPVCHLCYCCCCSGSSSPTPMLYVLSVIMLSYLLVIGLSPGAIESPLDAWVVA
ncbi:hypothetical protein BHM03_00027874 [Ensete ventricosum]|nr:hypothetical protein BHM03_00027874 [Ensete ventricosum]